MPREGGASSTPGNQRLSRKAAAYWVARSRLRQGFAEASLCWHAEALAKAASRAMTVSVWSQIASSISRGVFGVGGFVHQAAQFALVCDLQLEKPCLAGGIGIDQRGFGGKRVV